MENKNGQGIFYGVIGVATLVVAIIGATFAYFSAQATTTYNNQITGTTLDVGGSNLSLTVDRVTYENTVSPSLNLVPANMTESVQGYGTAVAAKCEDSTNKYTGCHLYKITAVTASELTGVTINLNQMKITNANPTTNWKYVVYEGTTTSVSNLIGTAQTFTTAGSEYAFISNGTLTAGTHEYYLLVYLLNETGSAQNDSTNGTDETGTYSGKVDLSIVGGGMISATFTAA